MNAHQRRVARRKNDQHLTEVAAFDDLYGDDYWDDDDDIDRTCEACAGTGGDPMNDGITPCEACDGEGSKWWL